jgi:predicted MFS family arabinose efflux permease
MLLLAGVSGFTGTALIGRVIGDRLHILLGALTAILAAVAVGIALFGGSVAITAALLAVWEFTATPVA